MFFMQEELVLISAPIIFKGDGQKRKWFIVDEGNGWEFPKVVARKVESSVRASIRNVLEKATMNIQVLEEAGRVGGVITLSNKTKPKRVIYYLATYLSGGEILGFEEYKWLPYAGAIKKLAKQEQVMFRQAKKELASWEKRQTEKDKSEKPPKE